MSITIRISEHNGLNPVGEVQITPDGVEAIRVMDHDGSVLTDFGKAGELFSWSRLPVKGMLALAASRPRLWPICA